MANNEDNPTNSTNDSALLTAVKLSLGILSDVTAYDPEITALIEAGQKDLETVCGMELDITDALVLQAVKTYVRMSFRSPADYDRLRASYESQKGHLMITTGYTDWRDTDGES